MSGHGAVHLFDLQSMSTTYRVLLFPGNLQVDVSVTPGAVARTGPKFEMLFGSAVRDDRHSPPVPRDVFGLAVHHALRARFGIERGRLWSAQHYIADLRRAVNTYFQAKEKNPRLRFPGRRKRCRRIGGFGIANDKFRIAGHVAATKFTVEQRAFDQLTADLTASPSGAQVQNGLLTRGTLRADFAASVGMRNWSAGPREPLTANAAIRDGDLADIVALAGQKDVPVSGGLNASARISGTIGNPQGDAKITVVNGSAYEEPFDRFDAQVNLSDQLVTLSPVVLTKGASKIDLNGTFRHPRDSFDTGQVQLHVASNAAVPLPVTAQPVVMQTDGDRTKCLGVPLKLVQGDASGGLYAGLFFPFRPARYDGKLVIGGDIQDVTFDVNQMVAGAAPAGELPAAEPIDTAAPVPLFVAALEPPAVRVALLTSGALAMLALLYSRQRRVRRPA